MTRKTIRFFLLFLSIACYAGSPKGTNIKITVRGLANAKMLLNTYNGEKQLTKDSFQLDQHGSITIAADTMLPGGIYLAVFPSLSNRSFEFIAIEPSFSIETDTSDLVGQLKAKGSAENEVFFEHTKYLRPKNQSIDSLYALARTDTAQKNKYYGQTGAINKELKTYRSEIIARYPNLFYSKVLKASAELSIPPPPKDDKGRLIHSFFSKRYSREHYWDNVDLNDARLLRTAFFYTKFKNYIGNIIPQKPDSINAGGDELLAKTGLKGEVYQYLVTAILEKIEASRSIMYDESYVYFAKKYVCNGLAPWMSYEKAFKTCDKVSRMELTLIGKNAPPTVLFADSSTTKPVSLYDVQAKYIIVAFWSPDCPHCRKTMPELADIYHQLKQKGIDVQVYAASTMEAEHYQDWLDFVRENNLDWINVCDVKHRSNYKWAWDVKGTPQFYVLDGYKTVQLRRTGIALIEDYIMKNEDPNYISKLNAKPNTGGK